MSTFSAYLELTKPRLLPLVLLSGLPALVMASGGWPAPAAVAAVLVGISLAAGAANAFNSYLERERDARMLRTASRPLPAGVLAPGRALAFGLVLAVLATALLGFAASPVAAGVGLAGIAFYVFVYTLWLKPRSSLGVIAGGVSGAVAPLIADAAAGDGIGAAGWILFAILFAWQPPHFWAISLYRRREYEAAGFPLLVSRIGAERVSRRIAGWVGAAVAIALLPAAIGLVGPLYLGVALALGTWFLYQAVRLCQVQRGARDDAGPADQANEAARGVFFASLVYLMSIFTAMILDLALQGGLR
jgi:protoheme IX farnesyltransferase